MNHPADVNRKNQPKIAYRRKNKDTVTILLPRGEREIWKRAAAYNGKSLNQMICDAVRILYVEGYKDVAGEHGECIFVE